MKDGLLFVIIVVQREEYYFLELYIDMAKIPGSWNDRIATYQILGLATSVMQC